MKNQELVDERNVLGFWRHFTFVRFIYKELLRLREENKELKNLILNKNSESKLTETISLANNIEDDEKIFLRKDNESVEDWLDRISTKPSQDKPKKVTTKGASELIEQARTLHINSHLEKSEGVNVSDRAIQRIGQKIDKR